MTTRRALVLFALLLLPLCLAGYGADNDTYGVLDSGRVTWGLHHLDTSRNPGYWVFEAIVFGLSSGGGYLATNVATLLVGMVCVWRFLRLAETLRLPYPTLTAAALVATPVFAIACASTNDYVWSLLGVVLFVECLLADRLALAILPAALAFAVRGANGVAIAGAIAGAVVAEVLEQRRVTPRALKVILTGLAAVLLACPVYALSWIAAGRSFAFLEPAIGPETMWTRGMRGGRFAYKLLYLFGPAAALVVGIAWVKRPQASISLRPRCIFAGVITANLLLFLRYPVEISYLIPAAFFGLLLLGAKLQDRRIAIAFLLAVLSLNFVTPSLARPDRAGAATAAHLYPTLAPGMLLEDMRLRLRLRHCSDYDCYKGVVAKNP